MIDPVWLGFLYAFAGVITGMVIGWLAENQPPVDKASLVISGGLFWPIAVMVAFGRCVQLSARAMHSARPSVPPARVVRLK